MEADFVAADVYDAPWRRSDARRFDVVYVNVGAINWLPDIRRWAGGRGRPAEPGGVLLHDRGPPLQLGVRRTTSSPSSTTTSHHRNDYDEPGTYADPDAATVHNRTEEWQHPLGDVVQRADRAPASRSSCCASTTTRSIPQWPFLEEHDSGLRMPAGAPRLPLMYSLRARAPYPR